jgi:26S proteasome regulatory subunit N10
MPDMYLIRFPTTNFNYVVSLFK